MSSDKLFDALASSPRRQILALLNSVELTTTDLAAQLGISTPAVSRHLSVLENADLVIAERRGQYVHYRLNADSLANRLSGFLFELCPTAAPLKRKSAAIAKTRKTD
jgi:DNA-binding transcriptional ArsR family regulator